MKQTVKFYFPDAIIISEFPIDSNSNDGSKTWAQQLGTVSCLLPFIVGFSLTSSCFVA